MTRLMWCAIGVSTLLAQSCQAADTIRGQWIVDEIVRSSTAGESDKVQLTLNRSSGRGRWMSSNGIRFSELRGLTRGQLESAQNAPVRFEIVRAAGKLICEGFTRDGQGAGSFEFQEDPAFAAEMGSLGFGGLTPDRVFAMAVHEVTPRFVRDLQSAGVSGFSTDQLMAFSIHGVTPAFVRELRSLGYQISAPGQLVAMRIHGASPEFIREVAATGYRDVPVEQLIAMRIHGVSPDYIRRMQSRGLKLPLEKMVQMRIHGID